MQDIQPEHERFTVLYNEVKDKLLTYFMIRLNFNREISEDLFMGAVLKAFENFEKFDEKKGKFSTWIFAIAHNHLVNFWRDNKKTLSLETLKEEGFEPAIELLVEEASRRLENQKVLEVLSNMKDSDKELISMKYFQDLSYAEIANITGRNEGALRTSLSRAVSRFGDVYKKLYS